MDKDNASGNKEVSSGDSQVVNPSTPSANRPLTFGEKAVGLTFNHATGEVGEHVDSAKKLCAEAIDMMDNLRLRSVEGGNYPLGVSQERIELAVIAMRKLQTAQMAMVKAITWKD